VSLPPRKLARQPCTIGVARKLGTTKMSERPPKVHEGNWLLLSVDVRT
jgi:hypothetical protein